eukprot:2303073-Pyramimonas_sp.AAC.1
MHNTCTKGGTHGKTSNLLKRVVTNQRPCCMPTFAFRRSAKSHIRAAYRAGTCNASSAHAVHPIVAVPLICPICSCSRWSYLDQLQKHIRDEHLPPCPTGRDVERRPLLGTQAFSRRSPCRIASCQRKENEGGQGEGQLRKRSQAPSRPQGSQQTPRQPSRRRIQSQARSHPVRPDQTSAGAQPGRQGSVGGRGRHVPRGGQVSRGRGSARVRPP